MILLIYFLLSWLVWLEWSLQRAHGLNLLMISSEFLWILDLLSLHKLIRQFLRINLFPNFRDSNYKYIMLLEVCPSSLILCSYFQSFLLCCVFKFTNLFFSFSNLPSTPSSVCVISNTVVFILSSVLTLIHSLSLHTCSVFPLPSCTRGIPTITVLMYLSANFLIYVYFYCLIDFHPHYRWYLSA